MLINGTQSAFGPPGHSFCQFEKSSPQPEIKVHLEFCFNLRSALLHFQSSTENLFLSVLVLILYCVVLPYLVKNSIDCVSVICKLTMKWYIMLMYAS